LILQISLTIVRDAAPMWKLLRNTARNAIGNEDVFCAY